MYDLTKESFQEWMRHSHEVMTRLKKMPTFAEMVLSGTEYSSDDYAFTRYEYDYSEGKTDLHGNPCPRIAALIYTNISNGDILVVRQKEGGGFTCELISKD